MSETKGAANPAVLMQQLQALVDDPAAFGSHQHEIAHLSRRAATLLEGPFEMFQRLAYSPLPLVAARIAQDHQIFKALAASPDATVSATELATKTGIKLPVLQSLLDYMTTQSMVDQPSPQEYKATKLSEALLAPLFVDGVTHFHDNCLPAFSALNRFVAGAGDSRTAFEIGQHSSEDFYTWMETHPVQQGAFHRFMAEQFASLPTWLDVVPFESAYAQGTTPETPVFVDVGGGNGQQCVALRKKFPQLAGSVVLQDRPPVLDKAVTGGDVTKMPYDYLTEQPVKGARAYYFRQILHNNDDETCVRILKSQLPAMDSSSVLLIDEKVLPDEDPESASGLEYTTALSLAMLAMFNALERREEEWRVLLNDAGYEIREIKKFTDFNDSVIVAVKKQ